MDQQRILVITPISHLSGVREILSAAGEVVLREDETLENLTPELLEATAVFTNPNKAKFYLGATFYNLAPNLEVICTASTGTNHIDLDLAEKRGIDVISLRGDLEVLEKISSTAELALTLTMACARNIVPASASVERGNWDYLPFLGRQISELTVGIVGLGRLGRMYANFVRPLTRNVVYYDPYVLEKSFPKPADSLEHLFEVSDVVSLHVHPSRETLGMVDKKLLERAKPDLILVNTSRGEIIDEGDLVAFLEKHPDSKAGVDVISQETTAREKSPLLNYAKRSEQVLVTPHVGGMTIDGQEIAFRAAAKKLKDYLLDPPR